MSAQFSWQAAVTKSDLEGSTKLVLLVIGTYMNQHGDGAFPSYKTIASGASLNRATVIRHVEIAVSKGWLKKRARVRVAGNSGRLEADSNTYLISFPVVAQDDQGSRTEQPPLVAQDDHPSRTGRPGVVAQDDPNTPSLTPQGTQELPPYPQGGLLGETEAPGDDAGEEDGKTSGPMTFDRFSETCRESGEKLIPADHSVFRFADGAGIPREFLQLAWREFARQYRGSRTKQAGPRGWRQKFENCVRRNWFRLWWFPSEGACELTTAGVQLRRERDAEREAKHVEQEQAA